VGRKKEEGREKGPVLLCSGEGEEDCRGYSNSIKPQARKFRKEKRESKKGERVAPSFSPHQAPGRGGISSVEVFVLTILFKKLGLKHRGGKRKRK